MSQTKVSRSCPGCGARVSMVPYDIGSGPEMCCLTCECCWGADGQPLNPLPAPTRANLIAQGFKAADLPDWLR